MSKGLRMSLRHRSLLGVAECRLKRERWLVRVGVEVPLTLSWLGTTTEVQYKIVL